jgi:hypothetical protein
MHENGRNKWRAGILLVVAFIGGSCVAEVDDDDVVEAGEDPLAPGGGAYGMRFETAIPMCTVEQLGSAAGCPSDDDKCLCIPELSALNTPKGSAGNPRGKVLLISQPAYGPLGNGAYAFDAHAFIKDAGNFVGHYVNDLNPSLACTAAQSWSGVGCAGDAGCGWRCVSGAQRANQIADDEAATYAGYSVPKWIALNEAWSTLYKDDAAGVAYRRWIRDLTKQLSARGKWPLLFVQERHITAGPYTLLAETSRYAWFAVESYLSGQEVLKAPGQCAPPYGDNNWCTREYAEIRNAIRNSASPPIAYERLIMVEHFGNNVWKSDGITRGWGRTFDNDPNSPTKGSPTTDKWDAIIERRARAMMALPSLGGVSSYLWAGNDSGTGSHHRVEFAKTYGSIALP